MKLKKREEKDYREKSKRPSETENLSLDRIARGIVEDSSSVLFKVSLSGKTRKERYNPATFDESSQEYYENQRRKIIFFKREDSLPEAYKKPNAKTSVRCIYHGNKNNLLPYAVYDMNWNLLWKEK
jgi:hypothetical protein